MEENEKEWTVKIECDVTVFDETKEGAEHFVFINSEGFLRRHHFTAQEEK